MWHSCVLTTELRAYHISDLADHGIDRLLHSLAAFRVQLIVGGGEGVYPPISSLKSDARSDLQETSCACLPLT